MERIKEYYKKNPNSKVVLGETSRSDFIKPRGTLRTVKANVNENRALGAKTYPQPKLAKGHTKNNVCINSISCIVSEQWQNMVYISCEQDSNRV